MLYSCNCLSIFLNKKLNRSYTQTSVLCRYKKRIFMTFIRCKILSFLKVIKKGFPYFIPKVYKAFSATFSYNFNSVIIKIYIIDVQTNTFGYTNSCAKKESENCQIPYFCFIMILVENLSFV